METPNPSLEIELQQVIRMGALQRALHQFLKTVLVEGLYTDAQALANELGIESTRLRKFLAGTYALMLRNTNEQDRLSIQHLSALVKPVPTTNARPVIFEAFSEEECSLLRETEALFLANTLPGRAYAACRFPPFALTLAYELRRLLEDVREDGLSNHIFALAFGEHAKIVEGLVELHMEPLEALVTRQDSREEPSPLADALLDLITAPESVARLRTNVAKALQDTRDAFEKSASAYEALFDEVMQKKSLTVTALCAKIGQNRTTRNYIQKRSLRHVSFSALHETIRRLVAYADEHNIPVPPATRALVQVQTATHDTPPLEAPSVATAPAPAPEPPLLDSFPRGALVPLTEASPEAVLGELVLRVHRGELPITLLTQGWATPTFVGDQDAVVQHAINLLDGLLGLLRSRVAEHPLTHQPTKRTLLQILLALVDVVNPDRDPSLFEGARRGDGYASTFAALLNHPPRTR